MDKVLFEKALEMPPNERLTFAELILASINYKDDANRKAWIEEVNNRMIAVNKGQAKLLDFEEPYNEG